MEDVSQETQELDKTSDKKILRDENGRILPGQESLNPAGRPVGSVSPITRLRQIWEEDPEDFENFVREYKKDAQNRKHIVEMLDGKPVQKTDITSGGDKLTVNVITFDGNNPTIPIQTEDISDTTA